MSRHRSAILLLLLVFQAAPARGADGFFRGDEIKPRSWSYDEEYFTAVLSYSFDKTWLDQWEMSRNGFLGSAGSLTSKDFYLDERVKIDVDATSLSRFIFTHHRAEDYDSHYQLNIVEWRQRLGDSGLFLSALGQVDAEKEYDDVGLSAGYDFAGGSSIGVTYWWPDFTYNAKAPSGEDYLRNPQTFAGNTIFYPLPSLRVDLDVGRNFPLELSSRREAFLFRYDKTYWHGQATYALPRGDQVWLLAEGELTDKAIEGFAEHDPRGMTLHRRALHLRLEHFRAMGKNDRLTVGGSFLDLREESEFPDSPTETVDISFREFNLYGWYRFGLAYRLSCEARLFLTAADDGYSYPADAARTWRDHSPQARLSLVLLWDPRATVHFFLSPSFDLDDQEFGGGNLQLLVTF